MALPESAQWWLPWRRQQAGKRDPELPGSRPETGSRQNRRLNRMPIARRIFNSCRAKFATSALEENNNKLPGIAAALQRWYHVQLGISLF
jgi:hypothetical protein